MEQEVSVIAAQMMGLITTYGLSIVGAIVILIVGWMASGWAMRLMQKALGRFESIDQTLRRFFVSAVRYMVLVITGLAVLSQFGVQTASLITVLGAAGLAIGLALQGTLSSVAAGVMLLLFRPFKIGDYVEVAGQAGSVRALTLFVTEMATPDNVHIVVPNAQVWGAVVKNYSYHPTRRLDLVVGIAYEDDIDQAVAAIRDEIEKDGRRLTDPEPLIAVLELGDSSVNFTIRIWCKADDYWPLRWDLTKAIKERLDADGITIPYPQRVVHMVESSAA
ncbi:MAG: mechanosensitive ion channel [Alphaproteobacteria bacterium]|nr:mechanosensitive ion channel [Alphaproteobacteria bacterium]